MCYFMYTCVSRCTLDKCGQGRVVVVVVVIVVVALCSVRERGREKKNERLESPLLICTH